jgi:protein tyrosine/serine phosphatase
MIFAEMNNAQNNNDNKKPFIRRHYSIWIIAALIVLVIWFLKYELIEDCIPKRFGVVEPGSIYRSGQLDDALVKRILTKYKIGVIVSLSGDSLNDVDIKAERQIAEELGIKRLVFPLAGNGTGDIENYARAISAICQAKKESKPVLIHCSAGAQRTSGVIAAYRLLIQKKETSFVLSEMDHYGAKIGNNSTLLRYLNSEMENLAILLKLMGVLKDIPIPIPQITFTSV